MRAVQVVEYGKPVEIRQIPIPAPQVGEVRLKVLAAGVNFADLLHVQGTYQEKPPLPFTLGMEVCGVVDAFGDDSDTLEVGQRVAAFVGHGAMAEYCCLPASHCIVVPDGMSDSVAAGFLITYGTAHIALARRALLKAGETLLVLGAGGGVGLATVEVGKYLGATVIAAASDHAKLDVARKLGADRLVNSRIANFTEEIRELGGADVVVDPVGGDLYQKAVRAANPEARIIPIGFASGKVPQIPANILLVKNLTVIGVYWGGYRLFNRAALTESIGTLMDWWSAGKLSPGSGVPVDLAHAADALDKLRRREAIGKLVIRI